MPLIAASGRLEGVLNLESPAVGAFSEQDSRLLQALATQAVIAIQEVRLLDALQEIAERLLTQPPQQVFDRLVDMACELLNVPVGLIWVLEQDHLALQASNSAQRRGDRLSLHDSLAGQAIVRRGPMAVDDLRLEPHRPAQPGHAARSALIVPLLAGEQAQPLGVPAVYSQAGDAALCRGGLGQEGVSGAGSPCRPGRAGRRAREALRPRRSSGSDRDLAAGRHRRQSALHRVNNQVPDPRAVEGIQTSAALRWRPMPTWPPIWSRSNAALAEAMTVMRDTLFHLRPIHLRPVLLADCLAEAMEETQLPAAVRVETVGLESLPPVHAGPRRLSLVFVNLLENAATAMEGAGVVTVRGAVHGAWIEVQVSDTGPGIAPALHERIFDIDFSGRRVHPGKLGFGLWWVKTLMARFGGSVAVASDGQHGATFTLRCRRVNWRNWRTSEHAPARLGGR